MPTPAPRPTPRRGLALAVGLVWAAVVGALGLPLAAPAAAQAAPPEERSAALVQEDPAPNTVTAYGGAPDLGPAAPLSVAAPVVGLAPTIVGDGYWVAGADGGVFTFGSAPFHGSTGGMALNAPIVGIAAHPGGGYWLAAADGGVFSFGPAPFLGSMGGVALNRPIVGIAAHPSGGGYWLVASDGGVFTFGDAPFHGSTGGIDLVAEVVGMAATPTGDGYRLAARDGGVFTFGDASFLGSAAGAALEEPVIGVAGGTGGDGYWIATEGGEVLAFGVDEHGSAAEAEPDRSWRTVAIAAHPGGGYWLLHGEIPVLETEDRGADVAALQRRLAELGYWVGPVDGVYGTLTQQAVYAFQKYEGLSVDGVVGPVTTEALARAERPRPASASGDLIEVDKARQLLLVVRDGAVRWAFNTSTGTEEPYTYEGRTYLADTPPGRWTFTRQIDGVRVSNLGRLIRPKYFHPDGIAIHGSSFVPPHPASHGCVRLTLAAIDLIWEEDLAPLGSTIWVYGTSPPAP